MLLRKKLKTEQGPKQRKFKSLGNKWYKTLELFMNNNLGEGLERREKATLRCRLCKFYAPRLPTDPPFPSQDSLSNNQQDRQLKFQDLVCLASSNQPMHSSYSAQEIRIPLPSDFQIITCQLKQFFNLEFYTQATDETFSNKFINGVHWDLILQQLYTEAKKLQKDLEYPIKSLREIAKLGKIPTSEITRCADLLEQKNNMYELLLVNTNLAAVLEPQSPVL